MAGRGHCSQDVEALDGGALSAVLVQRYISDPLLVNGRKFDLRVYCAVTSLDPLRVYVYREGEPQLGFGHARLGPAVRLKR